MAAQSGHMGALLGYANFWLIGCGVEINSVYGLQLLRIAAHLGTQPVIGNLCDCFYREELSFKDLNELFHWFCSVASNKSAAAIIQVGLCLIEGIGVERNADKAERHLLQVDGAFGLTIQIFTDVGFE